MAPSAPPTPRTPFGGAHPERWAPGLQEECAPLPLRTVASPWFSELMTVHFGSNIQFPFINHVPLDCQSAER